VKTFAFKVRVFTATPSEPKVPGQAPSGFLIPDDSVANLYALTRAIMGPRVSGPYPPDVVLVTFHPWATGEERQSALDYVKGRVIGGGWDAYFVLVPADGSAAPLWPAIDKLLTLPQVDRAIPDVTAFLTPNSRSPNDGTGWNSADWQIRALWATGHNWGFEAIEAPLGWGCATGNYSSSVAIVDLETQHSQFIESIVSGGTNDNVGLAGLLWNGRVWPMDASRGGTVTVPRLVSANVLADIDSAFARGAAVINLSWGQDYTDTASAAVGSHKRRIPNASDPNDVARAANLATLISGYLIGRETMYNHRPLYVIAAGNYRVDASLSGLPQLAASATLGPRVLVVAAADSARSGTSRALWVNTGTAQMDSVERGSNLNSTSSLITIAAPGANVEAVAGGSVFVTNGTSMAAPHVAAVAALLKGFDPRLTADSLKILLERGARRSGWTAGGTYPLLNAYESLRAAAERRTAPLCGNPIYQDSIGRVIVRRDSVWRRSNDSDATNNEVLFTATGADTVPTVLHGGSRIRFVSGSGYTWQLGGGWSGPAATPDTMANATHRSKQGLSHGRTWPTAYTDTVVTVSKSSLSSTATTRTERFQIVLGGSSLRTVDVTMPRRQFEPVQYNGCASWYVSDPSITNCLEAVPGGSAWRDSTVTRATVAMSPTGDTIVLAVARDSIAFDVMAPQGNGNTWERPYGPHDESHATDLYFVPIRGGSIRGPVRVSERVEAIGVSEDGSFLVAQTRNRFFSRQATSNVPNAAARHNICSAAYYRADGTRALTSSSIVASVFSSTKPCFPGSGYAP
jgi:hypothetical protein